MATKNPFDQLDSATPAASAAPAAGNPFDQFDAPAPKKGAMARGVETSLRQIPQTIGGVIGLAGDAAGYQGVKDYGMGIYKGQEEAIHALSSPSDSFSNVLEGTGDLGEFVKYGTGYVGGQAATALLTGGVGGFVGKKIAQKGIQNAVGAEAAKLAAERGAQVGAGTALGASNLVQEVGSIYPEAVEQAHKDGRTLDGADLARVLGAGAAAAGVETLADTTMLKGVLKGASSAPTYLKRAATVVPSAIAREAGTEAVQTGIERVGAQQSLTDKEAIRDYVDSAALGGLGGGLGGAGASIQQQQVEPVAAPVAPAGPVSKALGLLPAPVVTVDAEGRAKMDGVPAGTFDEQQQGVRSEPVAPAALGLPAPAIQVGPDGTATTTEQRNDLAQQPPAEQQPGPIETGAVRQGRNSEPVTPRQLPGPNVTVDGQGEAATTEQRNERIQLERDLRDNENTRRTGLGLEPITDDGSILDKGRPFKTRIKAQAEAKRAGATWEPVPVDGGFAVRQRADSVQDVEVKAPSASKNGGFDAQNGLPDAQTGQSEPQNSVPDAPQADPVKQFDIDVAAHAAATSPHNDRPEPTQAQKEAGNYAKGHARVQGLDVTVENPRGSTRSGQRPDGSTWSNSMSDHYGYIKRTTGADEEQVDVYLGPDADHAPTAFVVDQIDQQTGKFDETKVMLGYPDEAAARKAYSSNFDAGWKVGPVTAMSMADFKKWLKSDQSRGPAQGTTDGSEAQGPAARGEQNASLQALAERQGQVQQPAKPVLPQLRGQGDNAAPGMGGELSGLQGSGGTSPDAGAHAGPHQERAGLPAGQRAVGDTPGTGQQPAQERDDSARRQAPVTGDVGAGNRGGAVDPARQAVSAQAADRPGADDGKASASQRVGRKGEAIEAGGRPFKTRMQAIQYQKANLPQTRVVKAGDGFALREYSAGELQAQQEAGKRRHAAARSASYDKNPLMSFLAEHGLFHAKDEPRSQRKEFSPDRNPMVPGLGPVFRRNGKHPDALVQPAIEQGFLPPGADARQLEALIHKAMRGERVAPVYGEGQAELEANRRQAPEADFDSLNDTAADPLLLTDLDYADADTAGTGYAEASPEIQQQVRALLALAEQQGIDTETLLGDAARLSSDQPETAYYDAAHHALEEALARGRENRGQGDGQQSQAPAKVPDGQAAQGLSAAAAPAAPKPNAIAAGRAKKLAQAAPAEPAQLPNQEQPKALTLGVTPTNAEAVTVRDGVVYVGKYEAVDFDSGEPIKVPAGATDAQVKKALTDGGAVGNKQRFFGGAKEQQAAPTEREQLPKEEQPTDLLGAAPNATQQAASKLKGEQADKAKQQQAAAPAPDGFTLTGSDRPADVAAAAGQNDLFGATPAPAPAPAPTKASPEELKAKSDLFAALGDLGDILGKNTRLNITPEQEAKLMPVLARVFDAAFRLGHIKFTQAARYVLGQIRDALGADAADAITIDHLQGAYIAMGGKYRDKGADTAKAVVAVESKAAIEAQPENDDVSGAPAGVERNSPEPAAEPQVASDVQPQPLADGARPRKAGKVPREPAGTGRQDDPRLPAGGPALVGERGDQRVPAGDRPQGPESSLAGSDFDTRGSFTGDAGVPAEPGAAGTPGAGAEDVDVDKRAAQRSANAVAVKPGDRANIAETLPYLTEGQQGDVHKAETRFAKPNGYGMLFTNGTGTGKTFSGLGIAARQVRQGKANGLILVPDTKIGDDWIESGKPLDLAISRLESTKDAGKGPVITTMANFGDNDELAKREWDWIVVDEAHGLMQSAEGKNTTYLDNLRAVTHHPDGVYTRHAMLHRELLNSISALSDQAQAARRDMQDTKLSADERAAARDKVKAIEAKMVPLEERRAETLEAVKMDVHAKQAGGRARVTLLSATPFAYEKTVDWANGYLFDYEADYPYKDTGRGYNDPSPHDYFFIKHFGYRMRYGKLTQPDAKVDSGLMQRQFNTWLRREGVLSSRMLDVKPDYDRRFVAVQSQIGTRIDEAMEWLNDRAWGDQKTPGMYEVRKTLSDRFDYLSRRYLLEAIKAKEVVPIVKQHLALGRKVVVFHDYKKGGSTNPFNFAPASTELASDLASKLNDDEKKKRLDGATNFNSAREAFRAAFPDLVGEELAKLRSPIDEFNAAFEPEKQLLLINGDQKPRDLLRRYKAFQSDATGPQVALVQSAKNKGWSGHDTTGKHQRVLLNLGLPTQPTMSIQQEGRIYRMGVQTDAILRYLNTGTSWERWAFATTIAQRASAAENLSMGEQARALKDSYIAAFEEADSFPPGHEGEGKGGKARDAAANNALTEFDRAKSFYYGTQKKTSKNKAQEGKDYFATPEPVGLKMVQWASAYGGEDILEPSGGHGAIARWFPEVANRTAVEPSSTLQARLAMVFDGKIVDGTFEALDRVNKYDAIVMNPPFGVGGKTAVEHLAKAAQHLRDGGRIVALLPQGPAADKRLEQFLGAQPSKPLGRTERVGEYHVGDEVSIDGSHGRFTIMGSDERGIKVQPVGMKADQNLRYRSHYFNDLKPGQRTEDSDLNLIADVSMPTVTFERAGTTVATHIIVLQKGETSLQTVKRDYSGIDDIKILFDRIENLDIAPRPVRDVDAAPVAKTPAAAPAPSPTPQQARPAAPAPKPVPLASAELVTVTTAKGKALRGIIRKDLTFAEAKAIDPFTWKPKGFDGFFIREKHLNGPDPSATPNMSQGPGFFQQPSAETRRQVGELQAAVDTLIEQWGTRPDVQVVSGLSSMSVPFEVKREAIDAIKRGGGWPNGVYFNGQVFLFADRIGSDAEAATILYHEVLGHFGLRGHFGAGLDRILDQIVNLRGADIRAMIAKTGMDAAKPESRRRAAEEVLAYLAQTQPDIGLVKRAIAAIRAFLRDHVPGFSNLAMSDDELIANFILPARGFVERGGKAQSAKQALAFAAGNGVRPFYSVLAESLEGLNAKSMPAQGWKDQLTGLVNKGTVKADEVEWSGIREWLDAQEGKVSKDAVLNFVQANGVRVEEVQKGGADDARTSAMAELEELNDEDLSEAALDRADIDEETIAEEFTRNGRIDRPALINAILEGSQDEDERQPTDTRYAKYTLPGGENYREVLLTLPQQLGNGLSYEDWLAKNYPDVANRPTASFLRETYEAASNDGMARDAAKMYRSSHWSEPNILAHIRLNDRTDADGKKVLFVEELQSDWAQAGRKQGFAAPRNDARVKEITERLRQIAKDEDSGSTGWQDEEWDRLTAEKRQLTQPGVPRAPFVDSTDKWLALALKRIVKMAADEGYDRVAFVTGQQSADRYDLSKQIDDVTYDQNSDGTYIVAAHKYGDTVWSDTRATLQVIEDTLGKDIAKRIADGGTDGTLTGMDLKLGGEGMMAFYDKVVPTAVNGLLKKLGGGKVAPVSINGAPATSTNRITGDSYMTGGSPEMLQQPGFDITDAMKQKAARGMPLFNQAPTTRTIQVDGKRRPIENAKGQLVGRTFEEQVAFWKWYGDGPVDGQGRPVVVYHGTKDDITAFDAKKSRTNGAFFFSESPDFASSPAYTGYIGGRERGGGNVMAVYLSIQNPLVLESMSADPQQEAAVIERARADGHDGIHVKSDGRWVAFEPNQINSATGNNGDFDPGNPDIRFSQGPALGTLTPEQERALKAVGAMKKPKTAGERWGELRQNLGLRMQQGIFDQFAPIKDLDPKAYLMARLSKGSEGTTEAALLYGKPFLRDGVPDVDVKDGGFAKVLSTLKGEHDRFLWWVAALRADRLKSEGRENLFTDQDIGDLKTLATGAFADGTDRAPVYRAALAQLNEFNDSVLKMAEESGLIDAEARELFKGQPYVPFYRVMEDEMTGPKFSSGLVNQQAYKKLKGGSQQLNDDLLENMLRNWSHLYAASARNRAAVAAIESAERLAIAYPVDAGTKKAIKVMKGGEAKHYAIEDPYLMEAVTALHWTPSPLMKPLAKMKQLLTFSVTVNPAFKVRNLIRDSVQAMAQADLSYNPLKNVAQGWKASSPKGQTYASMLASGGLMRFGTAEETDRIRHKIEKMGGTLADAKGMDTLTRSMQQLWDAYNELGDRSENANRAALYEQLVKKGVSHAEASFMSRDLMDFSMSGRWEVVRFLTQTVPFLNARLQGLYKLGRAAKEDPKRFAVIAGAVSLASLALLMAYSDDEDWKKREDWDRDGFWWFKIGSTAYRIPKPFEVGAIGTLAERTAELMFSREMDGKRFADRMAFMLGQTFALNPVPQAFKPLFDVYANRDSFTRRPIESFGDEKLRPEDRFNEKTSELARLLGRMGLPEPLAAIQGEYTPLSPKQWDFLVRGYFSWVGGQVAGLTDYAVRPMLDRGERPDGKGKQLGGFVEQLPAGGSRYVTVFYEQAKDIEQSFLSYRQALKDGNNERAESIAGEGKIQNHLAMGRVKKRLEELNAQAKRVEGNKLMSGTEKRAKLDELDALRETVARGYVRQTMP